MSLKVILQLLLSRMALYIPDTVIAAVKNIQLVIYDIDNLFVFNKLFLEFSTLHFVHILRTSTDDPTSIDFLLFVPLYIWFYHLFIVFFTILYIYFFYVKKIVWKYRCSSTLPFLFNINTDNDFKMNIR